MEESNRDIEGGRQDRSDMSVFPINHRVVILSHEDGEGFQNLSSVTRRADFQTFLASLGMTN